MRNRYLTSPHWELIPYDFGHAFRELKRLHRMEQIERALDEHRSQIARLERLKSLWMEIDSVVQHGGTKK